ncbi:hypothetical protein [Runella zeae]|uniref:hypothetical protein n=1 Tax=Runella zeae TaxID=94255 RepID=UPI002352F5ED|nr:hypothetical protein [Runella zeae]
MSTVLKNWDFMRLLRMSMGLWLIYSAFADRQPLFGLMGGIFALQALFNVGCGLGGCATPSVRRSTTHTIEETHYEEVK